MDKEKQIEKMAKVIIKAGESYYKMPVDIECANREAGELYEAGYRKQSDTVREFVQKVKDIELTIFSTYYEYELSRAVLKAVLTKIDEIAEEYGVKID